MIRINAIIKNNIYTGHNTPNISARAFNCRSVSLASEGKRSLCSFEPFNIVFVKNGIGESHATVIRKSVLI